MRSTLTVSRKGRRSCRPDCEPQSHFSHDQNSGEIASYSFGKRQHGAIKRRDSKLRTTNGTWAREKKNAQSRVNRMRSLEEGKSKGVKRQPPQVRTLQRHKACSCRKSSATFARTEGPHGNRRSEEPAPRRTQPQDRSAGTKSRITRNSST